MATALVELLGLLALPAITLGACLLRASGQPVVQGTLTRDESRLALAARGILEHGIPVLPGGVLYTRGILPAYVEAGVFALAGVSDQAARLPAIVAGTLLVPATFWMANGLMGRWPALGAATIVAISPQLAHHAREGWFYPWMSLGFVLAVGALLRWYRHHQVRFRVCATLAYTLAILSHELAAVFVPIAVLADIWFLWRRRWNVPWRDLVIFWSIVTVVTVIGLGLNTTLRAQTAAGSLAEFQDHLEPSVDIGGVVPTLRVLTVAQPWLLPAAALGLGALSIRGVRGLSLSAGLIFLAILVLIAFDALILARRGRSRDIQVLLPLVTVAATYSISVWGPRVARALCGWPVRRSSAATLAAVLMGLLIVASFSPSRLSADAEVADNRTRTWVQVVAQRGPNDVVMTYAPTNTAHYLNTGNFFWLRPTAWEKYVWAGEPPYRDIQSGATVLRNTDELESLLLAPYQGRTLWIVVQRTADDDVMGIIGGLIARFPTQEIRTRDTTRVFRLRI